MAESVKSITLNNKLSIPLIGLGTSHMQNAAEVVYQSIKDGTRLIDTASKYLNEEEVGKGIKKAIEEGIVKREDLFVVTKCWITEKEDPEKAIRSSLARLQLDYVDLYLDHWPSGKSYGGREQFKFVSMKDMWPKMESLVEKGLTKSIGVSNYNVQNILIILSLCKIKPAVNEVEFHPYLYQKDLKEFCDKEGIKILAYNPVVKGSYCKNRYEKEMLEKGLDLLNEDVVKNLAKKYNKTPGQIVLNWHIHLGVIPIPGSSNPNRMKENLGSAQFEMEENDFQLICALSEKKEFRFCDSLPIYGIDIFA
jgi:diketogulonate reductase-like aldo/keto reductase